MINIQDALYTGSYVKASQCPKPDKPEYAFIGRSNVGKSSLINMLTGKKGLARISNTPGKTQTINHFLINQAWYLVDLPGYGFAKVSKTSRTKWEKMIREYLIQRPNLQCVVLLVDARLSPQKIDLDFINWLGEMYVSFVLAFTKTDKLSLKKTEENIELFKAKMLESWEEMPRCFFTSGKTGKGREELLSFINELNELFIYEPEN